MEQKEKLIEKMAKALHKSSYGYTGNVSWDQLPSDNAYRREYLHQASAIYPIVEERVQARTAELVKLLVELEEKAEAPKELMACGIDEEIIPLLRGMPSYPTTERGWINFVKRCIKAQLNSPKLAEYIQEQKVETIKAFRQYQRGGISSERCAEIIGVNSFEFFGLFQQED